jgi:hypothetical protein
VVSKHDLSDFVKKERGKKKTKNKSKDNTDEIKLIVSVVPSFVDLARGKRTSHCQKFFFFAKKLPDTQFVTSASHDDTIPNANAVLQRLRRNRVHATDRTWGLRYLRSVGKESAPGGSGSRERRARQLVLQVQLGRPRVSVQELADVAVDK